MLYAIDLVTFPHSVYTRQTLWKEIGKEDRRKKEQERRVETGSLCGRPDGGKQHMDLGKRRRNPSPSAKEREYIPGEGTKSTPHQLIHQRLLKIDVVHAAYGRGGSRAWGGCPPRNLVPLRGRREGRRWSRGIEMARLCAQLRGYYVFRNPGDSELERDGREKDCDRSLAVRLARIRFIGRMGYNI